MKQKTKIPKTKVPGFEDEWDAEDGLWIIDQRGGKRQMIAHMRDLKNPIIYGALAVDVDELASYLRILTYKYFNDTVQITPQNNFRYVMPPAIEMAQTILKFLAFDKQEKEAEIQKASKTVRHIDDDGNIVDDIGGLVFDKDSKEAVAVRLLEAKRQVANEEKLLAAKCIDSL